MPFCPNQGPFSHPSAATDLPAPHPVTRHSHFSHQLWTWLDALPWPMLSGPAAHTWVSWPPGSGCDCAVPCHGNAALLQLPPHTLPPHAFSVRFPAEKLNLDLYDEHVPQAPGIKAYLDLQHTQVSLRFLLTPSLICTRAWPLNFPVHP